MKTLTAKQQQIFDYIKKYQLQHGHSPTFEEIRVEFEFRSLNSVFKHVTALEKKGYIIKSNQARGIELLDEVKHSLFEEESDISLPLLGSVAAGNPIAENQYTTEYISVAKTLIPQMKEGVYLLYVSGDSMDLAGILDGDVVIVDTNKEPKNLDIVVALVDEANTVKRYIKKDLNIHLMPESSNGTHSEIIALREASIQGVVTASFRVY